MLFGRSLVFKSHFKKCLRKSIIEKVNGMEKLGDYTKKESTLKLVLSPHLSIDLLNDAIPTRLPYSQRHKSYTDGSICIGYNVNGVLGFVQCTICPLSARQPSAQESSAFCILYLRIFFHY